MGKIRIKWFLAWTAYTIAFPLIIWKLGFLAWLGIFLFITGNDWEQSDKKER